jgi:hypothetical protein
VVTGKTALLRAQRRWADARGISYDAYGCVRELGDNFMMPLDDTLVAELDRGSELAPSATRPARAYSLCSSAALVINVFAPWRGRDHGALLEALGVGGPGGTRLAFEEPLPTGLPGDPPTVDVALYGADGRCVAVESKFAEWLTPRPRSKRTFKDKYFPPGKGVWAAAALPRCQALAEELQDGRTRLKYLHAAQLLKHALGLAANGLRASPLVYLYYDRGGKESRAHAAEIERIVARLVPEIDLRACTYQTLFQLLREAAGVERGYLEYLAQRYFG